LLGARHCDALGRRLFYVALFRWDLESDAAATIPQQTNPSFGLLFQPADAISGKSQRISLNSAGRAPMPCASNLTELQQRDVNMNSNQDAGICLVSAQKVAHS
jgi:hypothetical protein